MARASKAKGAKEKLQGKNKVITGNKKKKESYNITIFKLFRQVLPELFISKQTMNIVDSLVKDVFDRLITEVAQLINHNKTRTISTREIETAVQLIYPKGLCRQVIDTGKKAVENYTQSKEP